MSDFKERLYDERAELVEKTEKLEAFLQSDKSNEIDQIQLALLGIQLPIMKTYVRVLDERFGRLED
jgi:hypothetical protein